MPINVLSVFSGGGGIDLGFLGAGYQICFSTDFWGPACDTLEQNGIGLLVKRSDIREVDYCAELSKLGMTTGDIDVPAGGPPCPAYLKSRFYRTEKKRALEDENSFALYEYFRALKEIRPKVFFSRTCSDLSTSRTGRRLSCLRSARPSLGTISAIR